MTARARLSALRVVGFKSFAERTTVEFGPGISAIVGPNGSGKSNLADALRWTLGEAGRSLRTRRSEDVIFAGSSSRRATSMADVTLVLENDDRLLPLEYAQVELGRRLFRSGENEYLLNRQRVRLRDLLEVLDAGNLADNAFLFIGQGMVDQALALRPEERRPLFEEAAGVRRHERRRRHAEAELAEAESNLERLRDLLAELRPQARRLAAQADQLQARRSAGQELAEALVAAARVRWVEAADLAARHQAELAQARAGADSAMADLRTAEEAAEGLSRALAERAERERAERDRLDRARGQMMELRLELTRRHAEAESIGRDRRRIAQERVAVGRRSDEARALLARPGPDRTAEDALAADLAALTHEQARLADERGGERAAAEATARTDAARRDEAERLTRRCDAARTEVARLEHALGQLDEAAAAATAEHVTAVARLEAARTADQRLVERARAARTVLEQATAEEAATHAQVAAAEATAAAARTRLGAVDEELAGVADEALARQVHARGGHLVAEGVEVDARFRLALAAALGEAVGGLVVEAGAVAGLPQDRGVLVLADRSAPAVAGVGADAVSAARALGGGPMAETLRRDPRGVVGRLVARTVWAPELGAAVDLYRRLEPGWQVVTLAGQCVTDQGVLRLAATDRLLRLRDDREALARSEAQAERVLDAARQLLAHAASARRESSAQLAQLEEASGTTRRELRQAEEAERAGQRRSDAASREAAWQTDRLGALRDELAGHESSLRELMAAAPEVASSPSAPAPAGGAAALAARLADLAARSDRLSTQLSERRAARRATEDARRRAEISLGIDEARSRELDAQAEELAGRGSHADGEIERLTRELATADEAERRTAADLEQVVGEGSADRTRLLEAERRASTARERLRMAEAASRAAEVASMEARLHLESQREALLVELAAIGRQALAALNHDASPDESQGGDLDADRLAGALDVALRGWQQDQGSSSEAVFPGPGRIAALRRRFHELGAGNPFAVEEYAEVRTRLETLESQQNDLEVAIRSTRDLIEDLNRLIADQFRATFAALEGAFARRFTQLFDGGEAQLSLTVPDDLSATGIEISARPPGKKRQPLQMLSGGERALTAVALLLAMLEVRPVPFCVLDEVDAALDEANITRFSQALRSLAEQTQFIVITHNRGTIETADALYGVTIGDDAVSHVISLRLPPVASNSNGTAAMEPGIEVTA